MAKLGEIEKRLKQELGELFAALRAADAQLEDRRATVRFIVARFERIELRMDGSTNHSRPHVHIKYKKDGHAASYAIDDGSRLVGDVPGRYDKLICEFIENNRADLRVLFQSTQRGKRNEEIFLKFQTRVWD